MPAATAGECKLPQRQSHKWHRIFAEEWPNFGGIVTCCGAEPSGTFGLILRPNFGVCQNSAHLYSPTKMITTFYPRL